MDEYTGTIVEGHYEKPKMLKKGFELLVQEEYYKNEDYDVSFTRYTLFNNGSSIDGFDVQDDGYNRNRTRELMLKNGLDKADVEVFIC